MAWVTRVTWVFVAVVGVVVAVAWAVSTGRVRVSMEDPYAPAERPHQPVTSAAVAAADPDVEDGGSRADALSDIEWSSPAPGGGAARTSARSMRSTTTRPPGEHADGRHEAQDR